MRPFCIEFALVGVLWVFLSLKLGCLEKSNNKKNSNNREQKQSLTRLSVQKLLELATLILNRLLHKMRPDVADSKVGHVHLHQVQHRENRSVRQGGINETGISVKQVCSRSIFVLLQKCRKKTNLP